MQRRTTPRQGHHEEQDHCEPFETSILANIDDHYPTEIRKAYYTRQLHRIPYQSLNQIHAKPTYSRDPLEAVQDRSGALRPLPHPADLLRQLPCS